MITVVVWSFELFLIIWWQSWSNLGLEHEVMMEVVTYLPQFLHLQDFNWPKKNSNFTLFLVISDQKFTIVTCWSGCRVQIWVQIWSPCRIWQSLPKAIPEDNGNFWLQNQWTSSWGSLLALLVLFGENFWNAL